MRIGTLALCLSLVAGCTKEPPHAGNDGGTATATGSSTAQPAKPPQKPPAKPPVADIPAPPDVAAAPADAEKTKSGLASKVLQKGTGADHPEEQDSVSVNYTGWTTDGKMFDSSVKRGQPATFRLGGVIAGWTEGLQLMVVGEKRRFWIPEELAYKGKSGPQGLLVFDIELLDIKKGPKPIPPPDDVKEPPKDAEKAASGIASRVLTKGTGKVHPKTEDYVRINYTGWTAEGKMLDSSQTRGGPVTFPIKATPPGIAEGIQLMVVGEKRRLWLPSKLASRAGKEGESVTFDIELTEIVSLEAPADVKEAPKDAEKTASGLASKILQKGTGKDHPTDESRVKVQYTGWTTDGKMFDSSVARGKPAEFRLGGVIAGWQEGVKLMVVGEKRRFWIPEELAYKGKSGPQGLLVFDIELLEIGDAKKNSP
jgi:FKBP-type peptidyl-prolyl cis-trans isomerase